METLLEPKLHFMAELNHEGHTEISWSEDDPDTIEAARIAFDAAKKAGFHMFEKGKGYKPGRRIDKFDPSLERIVMIKNIVAG